MRTVDVIKSNDAEVFRNAHRQGKMTSRIAPADECSGRSSILISPAT